ncbi:MAG TPA: hypothetical protein VFT13_00475 [Candidatus Krumholzibacteria bacterium]|nr:hypothetical protein [Candidatus Krumholzibacteria bacterium]
MARTDRARSAAGLALAALAITAQAPPADATGIRSPIPIASRARLDLRVVTAADTAPWSWDAQSRSPLDGSRFMADVTAGDERAGTLYLKGAASWNDADDALGRVAFTVEQGDYLYRRAFAAGALAARLFGDERRYFTGEFGTQLMEDDVVERFEHRLGVVVGATHDGFGAGYLASSLDDGIDADHLQRADARFSSAPAHVAVAYQHVNPHSGENHAIAQVEAAGHYRRLSAIVSYAQSGFGSGFFLPSGSFDTARPGSGYSSAAPENAATWAEARLRRFSLDDIRLDAIYRYEAVGAAWVNDLASARAGSVAHAAGLYAAHSRYALDGRLWWRDEKRSVLEDSRRRTVEATARAFLRDNSQMLLRAVAERREFDGSEESDAGSVQAGYRRDLQRFMGGVHAMLDGIGDDASARAGVEARVNWSATSALYARWIVAGDTDRAEAVYARLEFRPSARTWVTVAYGWSEVGDAPYMLEDRDGLPAHDTRDVVTLTVRGDF